MSFRNILAAIFIAFLFTGCATPAKIEIAPFDRSVTVEKPFDEVWSSLIRFLSTNDIAIQTIEKESGLISLRGEGLSAGLIQQYCAAQASMFLGITGGKGTGSITVVNDGDFNTVNANMRFQFTMVNSMANPPQYVTRNCESMGKFETALLNSIR